MKTIIAGNWKMNMGPGQAAELAGAIAKGLNDSTELSGDMPDELQILVCPPFLSIPEVMAAVSQISVHVGGQNLHHEQSGAFTGEISGEMLATTGCSHVLIGHSERRHVFGEDDSWINQKVHAAFRAGLIPVLCVGETEQQRDADETFKVVELQVQAGMDGLTEDQVAHLVIAYEPVWAIGTGRTATPDQAQEVHKFIREHLQKVFPNQAADVPVLYGGSVKPGNVDELLAQADINGALIGGASLKADSFVELVLAGFRHSRN